jgi:hypothetical protein
MLGTTHLLLPQNQHWPAAVCLSHRAPANFPNVRVWENPSAYPAAWIVHDVRTLPRLSRVQSQDPARVERRTREVLFAEENLATCDTR